MDARNSRGYKNNNPGNMIRAGNDPWHGEIRDPALAQNDVQRAELTNGRFCVFVEMKYGIRAMRKTLHAYQTGFGCISIRDYISHWAPQPKKLDTAHVGDVSGGEDQNDDTSYSDKVASVVGISPDDPIDLNTQGFLMIQGMVAVELGGMPYTQEQLQAGWTLA